MNTFFSSARASPDVFSIVFQPLFRLVIDICSASMRAMELAWFSSWLKLVLQHVAAEDQNALLRLQCLLAGNAAAGEIGKAR
jgi:hypothetical protein